MNSATRLHDLLEHFRKLSPRGDMRSAIASVFGIEDPKSPEIFKAYASILNLVLEIESKLNSLVGINIDLYARSLRKISAHLLMFSLDRGLNEFRDGIKPEDLQGLEFIADRLSAIEEESEISDAEIKVLKESFDQLIEEVRRAKIDQSFSLFLITHLINIRNAIEQYRFFGSAAIQSEMAKVLGEVIMDQRGIPNDPEKKSLFSSLIERIKAANAIIQFGKAGSEGLEYVETLFLT